MQPLFVFDFFPNQGWIRFGSYCYNIGMERKSFADAMRLCSGVGAYLVDVADR